MNLSKPALRIFYCKDARPKIVAVGVTSMSNVNTQIGAQWKALSAKEKLPYERMAQGDKGRYKEEKAAYDIKNKSSNETNKIAGGTAVPLSVPVEMGELKRNTLTHAMSVDDEKRNSSTTDVKMEHAEVINVEVVNTKKEKDVPNDVPPASQKSLESVEVDLLVDPQEKKELLKTTTIVKNVVPTNDGKNKENNNAVSCKVGKGFMGLSKSLAAAKSGVTRLFNSQEQKAQKEKTVVVLRAGGYEAVVKKSEGINDPLGNAKVNEAEEGDADEGASGKSYSGDKEEGKEVSEKLTFELLVVYYHYQLIFSYQPNVFIPMFRFTEGSTHSGDETQS